jgi:anti-sigma regulatory factor (Ser/Thr protein kinase)
MPRIQLAARLENLAPMLAFIEQRAKELGFDVTKLDRMHLAFEEALVNVINYAYPNKYGNIEITYEVKEDRRFVVEIIDWGIPFDPLSLPKPDVEAPIEKRKVGGLGVYLIRTIMDEVSYRREQDRNILTLTKY